MNIGLYIQHGEGDGVGGAELMMANLAAAWANWHDVDLIHHRPPLTIQRLSALGGQPFDTVRIRCLPRDPEPFPHRNLLKRYRAALNWQREISDGYDLFVNCTHWLPHFCHARVGILLVLFPFYVRPQDAAEMQCLPSWKRLRHRAYYNFEWTRRLATYSHVVAISEYARHWTHVRWGIVPDVIYPPVDVSADHAPKERLIATVGRFSTAAHTKKQVELVRAFRVFHASHPGWSFAAMGGLNSRLENHRYFASVSEAACGLPALVEANASRRTVKQLLARARIYWHATGLNEDTDRFPQLAEHFGISVVEAMAAGCVPVVINKGGPAEIVEHGVTGFVWNTVDDMLACSQQLASDERLWHSLSRAARVKARAYSSERFIGRMSAMCGVT